MHAGWRELSDTHLPPFAAAVTAGVAAVMSGYHDIDGDPVTGSSALLDGLLRGGCTSTGRWSATTGR